MVGELCEYINDGGGAVLYGIAGVDVDDGDDWMLSHCDLSDDGGTVAVWVRVHVGVSVLYSDGSVCTAVWRRGCRFGGVHD